VHVSAKFQLYTPPEDGPTNWAKSRSQVYNLIKYKVVSDYIIYILYYILAYIEHDVDVSLESATCLVSSYVIPSSEICAPLPRSIERAS
jgi:hypothetical protein